MAKKPDGEKKNERTGDMIGGDKVLGDKYQFGEVHGDVTIVPRGATAQDGGPPNMAPVLPDKLVVREAELADLRRILLEERAATVTALRGMGGIGKTTLAIMLCHEQGVIDAFPDGILWATVGPQGSMMDAQRAWAVALGRGEELENVLEPENRAALLKSWLDGKTCLAVIDDLWDVSLLPHLQVVSKAGATLVTTRQGTVAREAGHVQQLGVLKPDEALALLAEWAGEIPEKHTEDAEAVARRLGYLPLALKLAGALVADGVAWDGLLRQYEQAGIALLDEDVENGLQKAFQVSLDRLDAETQARFAMLSVFAAGREAPFGAAAAAAVWDVEEVEAEVTLRRLARSALVERAEDVDVMPDAHTLHLVLADFGRGLLDEEVRAAAEARHSAYYFGVAERSEEEWQVAEVFIAQLRKVWRRIPENEVRELDKWTAVTGWLFSRRGYWKEYINWGETLLLAASDVGDIQVQGKAHALLGFAYHNIGNYKTALAQYRKVSELSG